MWKSLIQVLTGRTARRAKLEAEVTLWLDRSAFDVDRGARLVSAVPS